MEPEPPHYPEANAKIPGSTLTWNPTLAHKTRKNGALINGALIVMVIPAGSGGHATRHPAVEIERLNRSG
ncbi:MAG: hypothetical protein ABSB87_00345 [Terriglobales bacterium]